MLPRPKMMAKKRKVIQTSLSQFATKKKSNATAKEMQKYQDMMTVKFLCSNFLPFRTVETKPFRDLIQSHNHHAKPMSRRKVQSMISHIEYLVRGKMVEELKGQAISVTLDHWTSKANQNYTGVTAHFIDETWAMRSFEIGLFLHEGGATGKKLSDDFQKLMLEKVKLGGTYLTPVTTDTAKKMSSLGVLLEYKGTRYCADHEMHNIYKQACQRLKDNIWNGKRIVILAINLRTMVQKRSILIMLLFLSA